MVEKNEMHGDVPVSDMRCAFRAAQKNVLMSDISVGILYIFKR